MNLLTPALDDAFGRFGQPVVVDAGSGNAYLGFILYELFFKDAQKGELWSVESRPELTQKAKERAQRLGYQRMRFEAAAVEKAEYPPRIHVLTALHACDTATDDALLTAIRHNADHVAVVPCCQAEVARKLKERAATDAPFDALFAHNWHRREFGSHLTNVIRALALQSQGYQVTVTELTGWEHSLKNELILGRKVHREDREAKEKLKALLATAGVDTQLTRQLEL